MKRTIFTHHLKKYAKTIQGKSNNQSQSGKTFYYVATCLLLLLMVNKPYKTSAKGFRLYLRKCRRVSKLLLAQILCGIFKLIDKYIKSHKTK